MRLRLSFSIALLLVAGSVLSGCALQEPSGSAADESSATSEAEPEAPLGEAGAESEVSALSEGVSAQVDYVLSYWNAYNEAYGVVADNDCVNFASQSLLARGWTQDDVWKTDVEDVYSNSSAWISTTAFHDYLLTRDDAVALDDTQRDQVAVGDIVQFDWDNSGDRDHTGVVTRVEVNADGTTDIYFAGHTTDSDFRSVDDAITIDHQGGTASDFHLISA